jgi:hypothetical protein
MSKIQKNISTIFLLPSLGIGKTHLNENGFINAFIKDAITQKNYYDSIYLLFRPEYPSRFRRFLNQEYQRTKSIIDDYDLEKGFSVVAYRLDSNFQSDFDLIKQSKYSKTSKEFQALFPKEVEIIKDGLKRKEISLQYRVFNRTPDLVEYWKENNMFSYKIGDEIWHRFEEKNETLTDEVLSTVLKNVTTY